MFDFSKLSNINFFTSSEVDVESEFFSKTVTGCASSIKKATDLYGSALTGYKMGHYLLIPLLPLLETLD